MNSIQVRLVMGVCASAALITQAALAQTTSSKGSANDFVVGVYAGEEPAFKDEEGETTGPNSYVFHLLPSGRCFMDATNKQTGYSGRQFGVYSSVSRGKAITVEARFFPGVDSSAVTSPATDYFSTFAFRFLNGKVTARYVEDSNAPAFRLSRVRSVTR